MMKNNYVFVYGTLRTNLSNHDLLKNSTLISSQCWTFGMLYDTGCGYPALAPHTQTLVYGELYSVSKTELFQLDRLEGYQENRQNNHYERVEQTVYTDKGISYKAYVYVYQADKITNLQRIHNGDWKYHLLLKKDSLFYFAYGSCMDDRRFIKQGVDHLFTDVVGVGVLPNYKLAFTKRASDGGRADIIEGSDEVEGKVYRVTQEAVEYLYEREGVKYNTYRPSFVNVQTKKGLLKDVLTFVVINKEPETAPPIEYAAEIIRGSMGFLSEKYRRKIMDKFEGEFGINMDELDKEVTR